MEALMYDREMDINDWQLFGGQLRDLSVQSTFADLQGHVLQNSGFGDSVGEQLYRRPEADSLEDLPCHYSVNGIDYRQPPSSLKTQKGHCLCEDDWSDFLSSSPEEAFLPVDNDDDSAVVNVSSTVTNSFINVIVPSFGGGSVLAETKFDSKNLVPGQQYQISDTLQNLSESQGVEDEISLDLIEVDKTIGTDSFAFEHDNALDSSHYENHYKPAAELDGIECAFDSLSDPESVWNILKQLVCADPNSYRPVLLSVSPEEVESVLSSDSAPRVVVEDYDSMLVPSSPPVSNSSPVSFSDVALSPGAVLITEYSQDSLSSRSSMCSHASSPCVPYSVAARPDRKLKKKEQNKTAALRYRNKKREEKGVVYTEVEELEHKNAKLQERADDLTKEINYLKSLLEEIRKQ
jgi:hypothetical protein